MATTNTLDRARPRFLLRLRDLDAAQAFDLHLYQGSAAGGELNIVDSAVIHSDHRYSMLLLANTEVTSRSGAFDINGEAEEEISLNPLKGVPEVNYADGWSSYQVLFANDKQNPFSMVFGLARMRLTLEEAGEPLCLETFDLACACDRNDYETIVLEILDELIDTEDRQCIDWMFSPVKLDREESSMIESAKLDNSSKSLESLIELVDKTILTYKRHLDYFALHAHCRTTSKKSIVKPESVRRLGRSELLWLAQNPEQLYESNRRTALQHNGKYFMASGIQTGRRHKSYDNLENRALLSFTNEINRIISRAITDAETNLERFSRIRSNLERVNIKGGLLPTLVLIDTYLKRELPLIEKAKGAQREIRAIRERLIRSLPGVLDVHYALPRRTKVFQEVIPYADIHAEMRNWNNYGRIDVLRDTLALRTWRIDKLYEYYALFKMLQQLRNIGFSPDGGTSAAFKQVSYSIEDTDTVFRNDKQVANVYSLIRDTERLTLYYQPVFYGDQREEHGITLHRTTASRVHPYWTPDYLIVHECDGKIFNIVIDAKFRPRAYVHWSNAHRRGNENRSDLTNSAFLDCILKYKVATCGSAGSQVDALWILYGRETDNSISTYQYSNWARQSFKGIPDGIAHLSPETSCIAEMLEKMGLGNASNRGREEESANHPPLNERSHHEANGVLDSGNRRRQANDKSSTNEFDQILSLVRELASTLYDQDLLFNAKYAQRSLGLSHSILKRKPASNYEAKLYSSQLVEIGDLKGHLYVRWRPNNVNKLKQLLKKAK